LKKDAKNKYKILVVDDAEDAREVIQTLLEDAGYAVSVCADVDQALERLSTTPVDLVITDLRMPKTSGMVLIRHVRDHLKDIEIMMITGYPSIEGAVDAVKTGATHYLAKPFTEKELLGTVTEILDKLARGRMARREEARIVRHGIIGDSPAMWEVFKQIEKAGSVAANVHIFGESGTGKELAARAIHYAGNRRAAPFVSVNCAAIPENLIESELFGHVRGAFTGAGSSRAGFFQMAHGGTLFLDEIGDASLAMQAKLLRAIQEKTIYRVGSSSPTPVDVRLICATNKDLLQLIDRQLFREDFYYRINIIDMLLPPLRERGDDILRLINHFHARFSREMGRPAPSFSDAVLQRMLQYPWPGNVRELENVVQKLMLMAEGETIDLSDLPDSMKSMASVAGRLDLSLAEHETAYIRDVVASVYGNKTKAATILQIDRKTLREKLKHSKSHKPI